MIYQPFQLGIEPRLIERCGGHRIKLIGSSFTVPISISAYWLSEMLGISESETSRQLNQIKQEILNDELSELWALLVPVDIPCCPIDATPEYRLQWEIDNGYRLA